MCKQKFSSFLRVQLEGQAQASLARAAGVTETAVSRWLADKTLPSFESCMRLARYFNISPAHLFEMIQRPDYVDLYNFFQPNYTPKNLSLEWVYQNDELRDLHKLLDKIVDASNDKKKNADIPSLVSGLLIRVSDFTKT
jgi:transcriptional regulator with XRE-family HTH domain